MKDRESLLPNRRKITYDDGSTEFVVLEYADQPTEEGTLLSKDTFLSDETATALGLNPTDDPLVNDVFLALASHVSRHAIGGADALNAMPYDAVSTNLLINGGFDVWQRGTSQTSSGTGSDDIWNNYHDVSTKTHSRQDFAVGQTDVPNNPKYYSRTIVTSGGTASSRVSKEQYLEDVTRFAGKTVTFSFYAKADSNKFVSFEAVQYFGNGGSATITGIGAVKIPITSAWARYTVTFDVPSISGKTIGANNCMPLNIFFDAGSDFNSRTASLGNQSGTFDIANGQLNYGSVALPFVPRSFADELSMCQRYTYPLHQYRQVRMSSYTVNYIDFDLPISATMRITPTISGAVFTVYNMAGSSQSGFTFSIAVGTAGGLKLRATKNSHGLTDAYAEVSTAGVLDAGL